MLSVDDHCRINERNPDLLLGDFVTERDLDMHVRRWSRAHVTDQRRDARCYQFLATEDVVNCHARPKPHLVDLAGSNPFGHRDYSAAVIDHWQCVFGDQVQVLDIELEASGGAIWLGICIDARDAHIGPVSDLLVLKDATPNNLRLFQQSVAVTGHIKSARNRAFFAQRDLRVIEFLFTERQLRRQIDRQPTARIIDSLDLSRVGRYINTEVVAGVVLSAAVGIEGAEDSSVHDAVAEAGAGLSSSDRRVWRRRLQHRLY